MPTQDHSIYKQYPLYEVNTYSERLSKRPIPGLQFSGSVLYSKLEYNAKLPLLASACTVESVTSGGVSTKLSHLVKPGKQQNNVRLKLSHTKPNCTFPMVDLSRSLTLGNFF